MNDEMRKWFILFHFLGVSPAPLFALKFWEQGQRELNRFIDHLGLNLETKKIY